MSCFAVVADVVVVGLHIVDRVDVELFLAKK